MPQVVRILVSAALVLTGFFLLTFGKVWGPVVFEWTAGSGLGDLLDVFVPFLPVPFVVAGAILFVGGKSG